MAHACWRSLTPAPSTRPRTPTTTTTSRAAPSWRAPTSGSSYQPWSQREATSFVGRRLGATAEAAFLLGLGGLDVEGPAHEDFPRIAELVERYADFPLGGTDASLVALAERTGASTLITLDRRHFAAVRPRHVEAFELLP